MAQTIAGIQLEAITTGPVLARMFPEITNKCVFLIVKNWSHLISSAGEKRLAKKKIKQDVAKSFPLLYAWMIKILISLLIKWFYLKRGYKFDNDMREIQSYL